MQAHPNHTSLKVDRTPTTPIPRQQSAYENCSRSRVLPAEDAAIRAHAYYIPLAWADTQMHYVTAVAAPNMCAYTLFV